MVRIINKITHLVATLFFVVQSPVMPGTCGSLVTVLALFFLPTAAWYVYLEPSSIRFCFFSCAIV